MSEPFGETGATSRPSLGDWVALRLRRCTTTGMDGNLGRELLGTELLFELRSLPRGEPEGDVPLSNAENRLLSNRDEVVEELLVELRSGWWFGPRLRAGDWGRTS